MSSFFCLTARFLQPYFHGRTDGGEAEWPPSPLRAFQSLVEAAARHWHESQFLPSAASALHWLEQLKPSIVAAVGRRAESKYRLYVPDNIGDRLAKRTEKDVRPTHLPDWAEVHYLFPLDGGTFPHLETLRSAARAMTHLGWGVDMIAGNAAVLNDVEVAKLPGEVWQPASGASGNRLRVPQAGTLNDLLQKHESFLHRIERDVQGNESFKPVSPLSAFRVVSYRRATEPAQRQFAAFSILKPDASGYRPFDTPRRCRDVAGMVRHATAGVAQDQGWTQKEINTFIHGKTLDGSGPTRGAMSPDRFSYLPLPTINPKRVESIRRVLISAPAHCQKQNDWIKRALSGIELANDEGEIVALLTLLPGSDRVLQQYVGLFRTWTTVTPLILPTHDGYNVDQAGYFIRMAFEQAGLEKELMNQSELDWRRVGYRAGIDLASRYLPPENLSNKPRYHVRVRFPHPIRGPIAVGSGRFRGFGLFAGMQD